MTLPRMARDNLGYVKLAVAIACSIPAATLLHDYLTDDLGTNALNRLLHDTGQATVHLLLLSLCVTPLRTLLTTVSILCHAKLGKRRSDWNWLVRLRRMLGLFTFFYATLHALTYLAFDAAGELEWVLEDLRERPFIAAGILGFVILIPLAATSTDAMVRWLGGRRWLGLHRLVYIAGVCAVLHYWGTAKVGTFAYLPEAAVMMLLLGYRLFVSLVQAGGRRGEESTVAERRRR